MSIPDVESISAQILQLHEQGFTRQQILLELRQRPGLAKLSKDRVNSAIRQAAARSFDSQRLQDMYEMQLEILAIVKELKSHNDVRIAQRTRAIEKRLNSPS